MSLRVMKYNPGFATDEALKKTFVVRTHFLKWIIEILAGNTSDTNQHVLVIGPRGSGKTTLVRRVAIEIREDPELQEQWYPIVFSEESYAITSVGEFWLEALKHLADQTNDERWQKTYEDLRRESDDRRLASRALAQLMDFADEQHKRIVLIIENLNMIFSEQLNKNADWEIRHALQNEKRLMLLGTATPHFDQIKDIQRGWFEFFALYELEPLTTEECRTLWKALTGEALSEMRIRPLQILTGGNPRLLSILAEFGAKMSLKELLDHLVELVDEYTEYFKSQLELLATVERKVFIAVLEAWEPVTASQVSEMSRISTSQVSALLGRLVNREAVTIVDPSTRKKLYQASERLFNIYYLMRNRNNPSNRLKAVVNFIVQFYEDKKLIELVTRIAQEACEDSNTCQDGIFTYQQIFILKPEMRTDMLLATPKEFFELPQMSKFLLGNSFTKTRNYNHNITTEDELEENLLTEIQSNKNDDLFIADRLNKLANIYFDKFKYEQAEPLYADSLKIREKILGAESLDVTQSLNNLATLYSRQGKYEQAESLYLRSLRTREKILGIEHLEVAESLNNLATLYRSIGKYEQVERLYKRALMIREETLGEEHPDVAASLNNLAELFESQGKYEEAEHLYKRSLMILEKILGGEHPYFASSLNNLAVLYNNQGKYDQVEPLLIQALNITEKVLGVEHPDVATSLNNLAELHERQGKYEEAEHLYKRSLAIYEKVLGEKNSLVAVSLNNLAGLYCNQGKYQEVEPLYTRALAILEDDLGGEHPYYALSLNNLAVLYKRQCKYKEAEPLHRRSLMLLENILGANHPLVATSLNNLAELYESQGKHKEAEPPYLQALEMRRKFFEESHPDISKTIRSLSRLYCKQGHPEKAEELLRDSIQRGNKNPQIVCALIVTLMQQDKWQEAFQALRALLTTVIPEGDLIGSLTDIFIDVAGAGYGKEAVGILTTGEVQETLKALIVGIQIYLGEQPIAAQEVLEVGKDVAQRIRDRKK